MKKQYLLLLLFSFAFSMVYGQTKTITGKVIETNGDPVIGATALIKGTNKGAITDVDGSFTITYNADPNAILNVSYVGYNTGDTPINGKSTITITLSSSSEGLNE